ncbi:MAG: serine--tRNA ligase [Candidatus Nomurabacteria bacterium]|jgi:seryl-tRNA synthetase|nr:serine--tRNA ligase [Candidatus Nomurabacteria bacterium]
MLDIKFIRENREQVARSAADKGYAVNITTLLEVDERRRTLMTQVDELRAKRNQIAQQMKGGKPAPELVEQGKNVKTDLAKLESELNTTTNKFDQIMATVPNVISPDTPIGDESNSATVREWGERTSGAVDHLDFALKRDWVDFERGAKVAGAKFYYLKNDLALLENAVLQFALQKISEHGFNLLTVPHLVNARTMTGAGFAPRTSEQSDEYAIQDEDLQLIATAEIPLTGYHADEIIDETKLPLLYAGYSPCYRREAGAAGKHTRGLFRVHQFNKLEMYAFCAPEQSNEIHEKILAVEEEICQELGLPYRVVNIASGDMGAPAWQKYDIEYWSPVDGSYRELASCSNCTDYQARNLNIRVRRADGSIETLHTLNGTAVALARTLVAIIENCQQNDGLRVPKPLRQFLNNREEI